MRDLVAAGGHGGASGSNAARPDITSDNDGAAGSTGVVMAPAFLGGHAGSWQDLGSDTMGQVSDGRGVAYPTALVLFREQAGNAGAGPALAVTEDG